MTKRNRLLAFAISCAVSILFWWRPLGATLRLALSNEAYTHIILILPLGLSLIYVDRDMLRARFHSRIWVGAAGLIVSAVLACLARWGIANVSHSGTLSLSMFALILWWLGSVILCFGEDTFRSLLFPLCFLFWLVPLPAFLLDRVVQFLQYASAFASRLLFLAIGVPVSQDGIMLSIPNLDIEVATECSSIRSSMMLVIITMIFAHLFLRSKWRKVLLVAAAVPLSVIKNGLRIVTIAELGTRVDSGFLHGNLHHHGGILFLGVAVVLMAGLLWLLRRTELSLEPSSPTAPVR